MNNINDAISFQNSNEAKHIYQPSPILLNIWKLLIANQLITQWQNVELNVKIENALDIFERTNEQTLSTLLTNLESKINQLKQTKELVENPENTISWLENYFFDEIVPKLRVSFQTLRAKNIENIEKLISVDWSRAGPKNLTIFFGNLLQVLTEDKNNFDRQRIIYLKQEKSAWQQYFKLRPQLNRPSDYHNELELMCRTIAQIFKLKLYAENYAGLSYALESSINLFQTYYDYATRSSKLLKQVQGSIDEKVAKDIISLPVYMYFDRIDVASEKEALVSWLGHSIGYWGSSPVSWQQLEEKLLQNSESTARQIFKDFYNSFVDV